MITPNEGKSSELVNGFPTEIRVARAPIASAEADLANLHDAERAASARLDDRRRLEHIAGRLAARAALAALVGPAGADAKIDRDPDGAPIVVGLADPPIISISHGRELAVAVAARTAAVGIDLCDYADAMRVRRVVLRFVRPEEGALVARGGVGEWCALWALKEAGAKALRHALLDGGLRATWVRGLEPPEFEWPALDAIVSRQRDHVIAVVYRLGV